MAEDVWAPSREAAGAYGAALVQSGMRLGLGTGRTSAAFVRALGEKVRAGLQVVGVPTSESTAALARELGITLTTLDECPVLDLAIDGADAVDDSLALVKGHGGALLREKLVAAAAKRFVVIVSEDKLFHRLGEGPSVPVEVVPFGLRSTQARLEALGAVCSVRGGAQMPFRTDTGLHIIDCKFPSDYDPNTLAPRIKSLVGVVEHGLFLGLTSEVVVARKDGSISTVGRS